MSLTAYADVFYKEIVWDVFFLDVKCQVLRMLGSVLCSMVVGVSSYPLNSW